ncbi:MAG TPA: septum formation family protein [Nakamurella sp.]|jgi:hypothetical protein
MLAIVIIIAVVGPAALGFGPQTAGVAVRAPIPGPPVAGDCVTSPYLGAGSALSVGIAVGVAPYAACPAPGDSRRDFGEIVSVTPDVRAFPTISARQQSPPDPDACRAPVLDYLGWAAEPWDPVFTDLVSLVGPDTVQYASGQRWIACALITGRDGYPGSVRDGAFGRAADLYGRCESTRSALRPRVGCDDPHDAEVFGVALVGVDGLSDLADSCTRLVVQRTGLADPTAGGLLQVRAVPFDPNTVPPDVSASKQSMVCEIRVTGDGLLDASLVGVGDRPLPWA